MGFVAVVLLMLILLIMENVCASLHDGQQKDAGLNGCLELCYVVGNRLCSNIPTRGRELIHSAIFHVLSCSGCMRNYMGIKNRISPASKTPASKTRIFGISSPSILVSYEGTICIDSIDPLKKSGMFHTSMVGELVYSFVKVR